MTGAVSRLLEMIHPGLEKGGTVTCLAGAMQHQLDKLTVSRSVVGNSFTVDNALGSDLDSLGWTFDVQRADGENDSDYRERLATETATRPGSVNTEEAVEDIVEQILGFHLDIEEYPAVDFVEEHGAQRSTGAMRIRVPFNKQLLVTDIERQVNRVKSAGIYHVVDIKYDELYEAFAELVTLEELLVGLLGGVFDDTLATLDDSEGPDVVGVSFIPEEINPVTTGEDLLLGISGGIFDGDNIDPLTTALELLFNARCYFTGAVTPLVDSITAVMKREPFTDSYTSKIARIGVATIGYSVLAPNGFIDYFDSTWDNGEWDEAYWDTEQLLLMEDGY